MRPIIGITSLLERVTFGIWDTPAALVPLTYVQAVEHAGGRALVVPPSVEGLDETLEVLDGLLLSGGADLDPAFYGADAHPRTNGVQPERDRAELALLERALARDLPVLAVCRGMEVLNVVRGGDLVQHLPEVVGHERHKHTPGVFGDHDVTVKPDSRLGQVLGQRAPVKSHHHQAPRRAGAGLKAVAWAEDGTIEALEDPDKRFAVGVLWHPEEGEDFALFKQLVEEARAYREERGAARRAEE